VLHNPAAERLIWCRKAYGATACDFLFHNHAVVNRRFHSLTGQCALILGEAIEFMVDVKEPLRESAKFTLSLRLQLRLE